MKVLLLALGFAAIFEGLMPLINPQGWQETLKKITQTDPAQVRRIAAGVICTGLAIVWTVGEYL